MLGSNGYLKAVAVLDRHLRRRSSSLLSYTFTGDRRRMVGGRPSIPVIMTKSGTHGLGKEP